MDRKISSSDGRPIAGVPIRSNTPEVLQGGECNPRPHREPFAPLWICRSVFPECPRDLIGYRFHKIGQRGSGSSLDKCFHRHAGYELASLRRLNSVDNGVIWTLK